MTTLNAYNVFKAIVDSGDNSSPNYWQARENYEDALHFYGGLTFGKAQAFAATMQEPWEFNIAPYRN